jgi:hypothetical protein
MVLYEEKGSIFNTTDTERTVLLFLLLQNIDLILIKCWWMWEAWRSLFYLFYFLTWRIFFNCVCDLGYALLLLEILLGLCLFQLCLWHRICLLSSEVIKIIQKNKIFRILHSKFTHDTFRYYLRDNFVSLGGLGSIIGGQKSNFLYYFLV